MMNYSISSFNIKASELDPIDLEKIIIYGVSSINEDAWNIEFSPKLKMLNGSCYEDNGHFYMFLVKNNLHKKIEIVRG